MALNDTLVRSAKPLEKDYKLNDGRGLYLLVTKAGGKLWRVKFRIHGKEKKLSIGSYPDVSLARARRIRDEARIKIADGIDPALEKRKAKATARFNASWTEWKPRVGNPALRIADKSIVTRRITGVDFQDEDHSEHNWDDED